MSALNIDALAVAVRDVAFERQRQHDQWGEQNHDNFRWLAILGEEVGESCEAALHDEFGGSQQGTLRKELVQVAAVALAFIECLDRRAPTAG